MKEIERVFLISFIISSLALTLSIVCIPLLHFNLEDLTALVHKDMEYFKNTTDSLWKDLVVLEGPTPRDKRDDPGPYVYRYKPTLKDKIKRTYPKGRARAAPTVEVRERPGKQLFTDSEYIGSLVPMGQKEDDDSSPTVVQPRCQMKLIPNPKCPQGAPGAPGEDGENGSDGLPGLNGKDGETGTDSYQHKEESCIQCPVGEPGIKGPPGPPGDLGSPGLRGRNGILTEKVGPRGPTGPPGAEGEKGIPGPRGQMGVSVKKWICPPGDKGLPGPKGPRGSAGPLGDQGENGIQGVRGRRGPRGPAGQQGVPGPMGAEGSQGRLGFEEHYCECPARSKGVRGRFELPVIGAYVSKEDDNYPRNIFLHK